MKTPPEAYFEERREIELGILRRQREARYGNTDQGVWAWGRIMALEEDKLNAKYGLEQGTFDERGNFTTFDGRYHPARYPGKPE